MDQLDRTGILRHLPNPMLIAAQGLAWLRHLQSTAFACARKLREWPGVGHVFLPDVNELMALLQGTSDPVGDA